MKYDVYLTARAKRQYERLDAHIRNKIRTELLEIEEDPYKNGELLQGLRSRLRYIKIIHAGVQYRAVYDIAKDKKEVLVIFIGSRENFYKELRRFLA
jgi:mRNA-degrading endonuclease RelE of RelBE toxin-antitoxin system